MSSESSGKERTESVQTCKICGFEAESWEEARQHYLNSLEHEAEAQRSLQADNQKTASE